MCLHHEETGVEHGCSVGAFRSLQSTQLFAAGLAPLLLHWARCPGCVCSWVLQVLCSVSMVLVCLWPSTADECCCPRRGVPQPGLLPWSRRCSKPGVVDMLLLTCISSTSFSVVSMPWEYMLPSIIARCVCLSRLAAVMFSSDFCAFISIIVCSGSLTAFPFTYRGAQQQEHRQVEPLHPATAGNPPTQTVRRCLCEDDACPCPTLGHVAKS